MQHVIGAAIVRHVVALHVHALRFQQLRQSGGAGRVRAVAEPDGHAGVVDPEAVPGVRVGRRLELAEHRDPEPLQLVSRGRRLRAARRLDHAQQNPAATGHHQRVVHVHGVHLALERLGHLHFHA